MSHQKNLRLGDVLKFAPIEISSLVSIIGPAVGCTRGSTITYKYSLKGIILILDINFH